MTEEYLKQFERWVAGPKERKAQARAELEEHLRAAEAAGDVEALARLGTPKEAAKTFTGGPEAKLAPLGRRIAAALVDSAVMVSLIVAGIGGGTWASANRGELSDEQIANLGPIEQVAIVLVIVAALYWIVGTILLEWKIGRTLGKAMFGLRVVTEDGTAPSFGQVVLRRVTFIFSGPLQLIDWAFMFFTPKHQRAFEMVAHTVVVQDETTTEHLQVATAS
ncbi:MAG TPA: RDD family protein [Actinomycetota bacterium]|nr:RDD family protein [Actinomycetota bacterium]